MRQFQCVPTTYINENKETYLSRIISISFAPLNHLKLPISFKIPVTMEQIVYIYITAISPKIVSEYDLEIPQSQTAHKPMAPRGRATPDTRKTH